MPDQLDNTARPARTQPMFRRLPPEERKRAIIQATLYCLSRFGPHGTGVREISRQVNVSPGLLGHYFASKEDLFVEAFRTVTAEFHEKMRSALSNPRDSAENRLRAFVRTYFSSHVTEDETVGAYLAFWNLARTDQEVRRVQRTAYRNLRDLLEPVLKAVADDRGARIDEREAAISLIALLDGLWLELCLDATAFSRKKAVAMSWSWIDTFLQGDRTGPVARRSAS